MRVTSSSGPLSAELLGPEDWSSPLERFGRTMNVAVALTDVTGGLLGECQNPQPVWLAAQKSRVLDRRGCPFCLSPQPTCRAVAEAVETGNVTLIKDRCGLAHVAAPLSLDGVALGALIAGQVFIEYPQHLPLQRLAKEWNVSDQLFWPLAMQRPPTRPATLRMYGDLLESLGQALVRERYAGVLARRLENALKEKTILLQEVHHRVKNNMAVIASLLGMQADSVHDEAIAVHLRESQRRVYSMAAIHEHLYGSENLKQIRFDEYARELSNELCASYSSPPTVQIKMEIDPIELGIRQALPCGLILSELLSNVFKYAFPNHRPGLVRVGFTVAKPGFFRLSVYDNGIGLPPRFKISEAKSLGLRIVQVLTEQLSGTLAMHRDEGTRIELTFPIEGTSL